MSQSVSQDCMKPKPCFSFSKPPLAFAPAFAEPLSVHASRRIQTGFPSRLYQPCLVSCPCIILCSLVCSDLIMCTSSAKCTVMQLRRLTHKLSECYFSHCTSGFNWMISSCLCYLFFFFLQSWLIIKSFSLPEVNVLKCRLNLWQLWGTDSCKYNKTL